MMDPISAVGVAAAAVAFLDFSVKTLVVCKQLRDLSQQGEAALPQNLDIERRAKTLQRMTKDLTLPCAPSNSTDKRIRDIGLKCASLAEEMQTLLGSLKVQGNSFSKTLKTALKNIKERRTIEKLEVKIREYQTLFDTSLLLSIRERLDALSSEQRAAFDKLHKNTREVIDKIAKHEDIMKTYIKTELAGTEKALTLQLLDNRHAISSHVSQEHKITRQVIQKSVDTTAVKEIRQAVLDSLFFQEYKARLETVSDAWEATFQWIFDLSPEALGPWDNFALWLRGDEGIYWIYGKPGSGKSTLMSFILQESQMQEGLKDWAKGHQLTCLSFFFWSQGTQLQKNYLGLLRSLLYQLLKADPSLIDRNFATGSNIPTWTLRSLQSMLLRTLQSTEHCVCIFLDGLDEFEGGFQDTGLLLETIAELAALPRIKLCVSSRPELHLENALEASRKLRLQDLTRQDLTKFVDDRLQHIPEERLKIKLRDNIVYRAEGVFLWTSLVMDSLLAGIQNLDSQEVLFERLNQFPQGLEPLYKYMLDTMEKVYHNQARTYFLVAQHPWVISIIVLTIATDEELADIREERVPKEIDTKKISRRYGVTKRRIQIYTKGFLERREILDDDGTLVIQTVGFTHRTASEFIFESEPGRAFMAIESPSQDQIRLSMLNAMLNDLLWSSRCSSEDWPFKPRVRLSDFVRAAAYSQVPSQSRDQLLDELFQIITWPEGEKLQNRILLDGEHIEVQCRYPLVDLKTAFLCSCLEYGLQHYVHGHVRELILDSLSVASLLRAALGVNYQGPMEAYTPIINTLLRKIGTIPVIDYDTTFEVNPSGFSSLFGEFPNVLIACGYEYETHCISQSVPVAIIQQLTKAYHRFLAILYDEDIRSTSEPSSMVEIIGRFESLIPHNCRWKKVRDGSLQIYAPGYKYTTTANPGCLCDRYLIIFHQLYSSFDTPDNGSEESKELSIGGGVESYTWFEQDDGVYIVLSVPGSQALHGVLSAAGKSHTSIDSEVRGFLTHMTWQSKRHKVIVEHIMKRLPVDKGV